MVPSLRQLHRSRALRALSAMAWLMLVVMSWMASSMPLHAAGSAMVSHMSAGTHGPVMVGHAASDPCCDTHADGDHASLKSPCHCPLLCSLAVVPADDYVLATVSWRSFDIPSWAPDTLAQPTRPPLRPPLA
jgi:hypothetical protein